VNETRNRNAFSKNLNTSYARPLTIKTSKVPINVKIHVNSPNCHENTKLKADNNIKISNETPIKESHSKLKKFLSRKINHKMK